MKGWNWGEPVFKGMGTGMYSIHVLVRSILNNFTYSLSAGSLMSFLVDSKPAFEIPLQEVSRVTSGKNEVALEFHQGDSSAISLMEMRFHIPPSTGADGEEDPVQV